MLNIFAGSHNTVLNQAATFIVYTLYLPWFFVVYLNNLTKLAFNIMYFKITTLIELVNPHPILNSRREIFFYFFCVIKNNVCLIFSTCI